MDSHKIDKITDWQYETHAKNVIYTPTHFEGRTQDHRDLLTKSSSNGNDTSQWGGIYSSTYVRQQVLNHIEYGNSYLGKAWYFSSSTVVNNARSGIPFTGIAHNAYDTANAVGSGVFNIWIAGFYEFDFSCTFNTSPNTFTYAECWLRYRLSGVLVADDALGNTGIVFGGTATGWTLKLRRSGYFDPASINEVLPIIQVNTATNPVNVYNGWWQGKLVRSDRERA